jgi:hypothetical protein
MPNGISLLHGKGCRTGKDRSCRLKPNAIKIGVIVYAEYSYDRIKARQRMAEEL